MNILGTNVGVFINNSGILADSVSISQTASLGNNRYIGSNSSNNFAPQGPTKTDIGITYLLNLATDPVFAILNGLKSTFNGGPATISIGGITGLFYLNNYSFRLDPSNPVFVSASYTNYDNITGRLTGIQYDLVGNINDRIASSCSSYFSGAAGQLNDIFSIGYNAQINWKPQYKLGSKVPYDVDFLSINESVEVETNELFINNLYGISISTILSGYNYLVLTTPISNSFAQLQTFDLSNSIAESVNSQISNGSLVKHKYSFTKTY